jgi:hypothetical protein
MTTIQPAAQEAFVHLVCEPESAPVVPFLVLVLHLLPESFLTLDRALT